MSRRTAPQGVGQARGDGGTPTPNDEQTFGVTVFDSGGTQIFQESASISPADVSADTVPSSGGIGGAIGSLGGLASAEGHPPEPRYALNHNNSDGNLRLSYSDSTDSITMFDVSHTFPAIPDYQTFEIGWS